jgi:hypothetical protein
MRQEIEDRLRDLYSLADLNEWRLRHHGLRSTEFEKVTGDLLHIRDRIRVLETLRDALYEGS